MSERFYKRSEVRQELRITKYRYQQLLDTGIIAAPIRLSSNSHPLHTETQLQEARRKINLKSNPEPTRSTSILSNKMFSLIQNSGRK